MSLRGKLFALTYDRQMAKAPSFVSPLIVGSVTAPAGAARRDAHLVRQDVADPVRLRDRP